MRHIILVFITAISLLFLSSCGTDYEKLEAYYFTDNFLEAAQLSVEHYSDPKLKPKIDTFIDTFGSRLLEKLLLETDKRSQNVASNDGLLYVQDTLSTLENMKLQDFNIPDLDQAISDTKKLLSERKKYFIAVHYSRGIESFEAGLYQQALVHFKNVQFYQPTYRDTVDYVKTSMNRAERIILIDQFYREEQTLSNYIAVTLLRDQPDIKRKPVVAQGINVSVDLPKLIKFEADKQSSDYMNYFFKDGFNANEDVDYLVSGKIDLVENDYSDHYLMEVKSELVKVLIDYENIQSWETAIFQYEVYKTGYQATLALTLYIYDVQTQELVRQIVVEEEETEEYLYRGRILQEPENAVEIIYPEAFLKTMETPLFINKSRVLDRLFQRAAYEGAEKINRVVDQDLDPKVLAN